MFSARRSSSRHDAVLAGLEAPSDHGLGWDVVLRELATDPGLDEVPPRVVVPVSHPGGSRAFGGLLDLALVAVAVLTALVVAALGYAVVQAV